MFEWEKELERNLIVEIKSASLYQTTNDIVRRKRSKEGTFTVKSCIEELNKINQQPSIKNDMVNKICSNLAPSRAQLLIWLVAIGRLKTVIYYSTGY